MGATKDKAAGKAKEGMGKLAGDRQLESEGKRQHAVGKVKDAAGAVKETAEDARERVTGR